jgi:hypothetical protein
MSRADMTSQPQLPKSAAGFLLHLNSALGDPNLPIRSAPQKHLGAEAWQDWGSDEPL